MRRRRLGIAFGRRGFGARRASVVCARNAVAGKRHVHLASNRLKDPARALISSHSSETQERRGRTHLSNFLRAPSAETPLPSSPASSRRTISRQCDPSKLGVYLCSLSERSQAGMSPRRVRSTASSGLEPEPTVEGRFVFPPGERSFWRGERRGEPMPACETLATAREEERDNEDAPPSPIPIPIPIPIPPIPFMPIPNPRPPGLSIACCCCCCSPII